MASDQVAKRLANQYAILKELNAGVVLRRTDLSRRLDIRKSSITSIVGSLLEKGVLREERPGNIRSAVGLNDDSFYAAVASVSMHGVQFARVNLRGVIEHHHTVRPRGQEKPKAVTERLVKGLAKTARDGGGTCLGYGVSIPDVMDGRRRGGLRVLNLHDGCDISLAEELEKAMGAEVHVAPAVRCQLWSCAWFDGWAQDLECILYLLVSEGVACALLTRGALHEGPHVYAGEIGHVRTGADGRLCSCGGDDCLETYCSVPSMISDVLAVRPDLVVEGAADLARLAVELADMGDVLNESVRHLARALSGVIAVMNPAIIVLGSEASELSWVLKPMLERHLRDEWVGVHAGKVEVRAVGHARDVALRGIAGLVMDRAYMTGEFSAHLA